MEETLIMSAVGQQDVLELYTNKILIKGVNQTHEFEIFLNKITAILLVHASGIVPGSIEFFFSGAGRLEHKFNNVIFSKEQQPKFDEIKEAIENIILEFK